MEIETEIKEINEKQAAALSLMKKSAAELSNELNQGVQTDVRKHLAELSKLIDVYERNETARFALIREKENQLMFNNLIYIHK